MHARVTSITADQRGLEAWRGIVLESIAPQAASTPGFVRALWLLQRTDDDGLGRGLAVTVWEDLDALESAEAGASGNRERLARATGGRVQSWRCEVVAEAIKQT